MTSFRFSAGASSSLDELAPWLRIAHRYDGLRELDDQGELAETVRHFFKNTSYPWGLVTKKTPWCSAFACTVFQTLGIPHPRSARARDFVRSPHFVKLKRPVRGAVCVFERRVAGRPNDQAAHVTFCDRDLVSVQQQELACFGGNQDNGACLRRQNLEGLIAALWPQGWPLPPGAELE
jgi:uncharacterized protein (TIGR02594 family)